jgi:hypothetical protein
VRVDITISPHRRNILDRILRMNYWWHASTSTGGSRDGFAPTIEKAKERAERAARELATSLPQSWFDERYTVEVTDEPEDPPAR